jgi:hypothetical protein
MKTLDIPSSNIKLCNVFSLVNADGQAKKERQSFGKKKIQTFKSKKETPDEKKMARNTHFKCKQEGMHR